MARQWRATAWGSPDIWEFADVPVGVPGPGEVTIRVRAAGVNPADAKHVAAERPGLTLPVPIGYEVSGELSAIGPDTVIGSGVARVGDDVLAFRVRGGYATSLTVPAADVFAKPAGLSHEEAAGLLLAGTTRRRCSRSRSQAPIPWNARRRLSPASPRATPAARSR